MMNASRKFLVLVFAGSFAVAGVRAGTDGKAAGQECGPGWRALRFDIEVQQARPLTCECVNARRGSTAKDSTAVDAQFAVSQIVHQNNDNVWLVRLLRGSGKNGNGDANERSQRAEPF